MRTIVVIALLAGGCIGGNESTPFPPGLEPLEDSTAEPPEGTPDDPYPETVNIEHGENLDWMWAHSRGYIHAPTSAVWAALKDPLTVADRRRTDEQMWDFGVEPEYEFSFELHYIVHELIDVEWDENWRYGTVEGPKDAPLLAISRSQKVYGSSFIDLLETSIIIREVEEGITEIEAVEHLDALMTESSTIAGYMQDLYDSVKAVSHGEPLPEY